MSDRRVPDGPLNVLHDAQGNEFYINLSKDEENKAYLQYSRPSAGIVDLEHTVVPYEFRGQGIAKVLAKEAFDHFVKANTRMRLTCTYLQKFYIDDPLPQYRENVVWPKL